MSIDEPELLAEPRQGVPDVIDSWQGFRQICHMMAAGRGPLAADAERASGFRYGHDDWLIQFKREDVGIVLLDPRALEAQHVDWQDFCDAIGPDEWILHDARQDLPGFADLGLVPQALFDTEVAARLIGLKKVGLSYVCEHFLGYTLAKEHSAADWSLRPLPRDWRNYAALDVELLIELRQKLLAEIKKQGKLEWARQEFEWILNQGLEPKKEHPLPWTRVSHFSDISADRRALAIVKELWTTRDNLARQYDIDPQLLLEDSSIIEAAIKKPHNAKQFRALRSLNERVKVARGDGRDHMFARYAPIQHKVRPRVWKEAIDAALALPASQLPTLEVPGSAKRDGSPKSMTYWQSHHPDRYQRLMNARSVLNQIAQDTRTPVEMIVKPKIIRMLCWQEDVHSIDVAQYLSEHGARQWQIALVAESVTRAIM